MPLDLNGKFLKGFNSYIRIEYGDNDENRNILKHFMMDQDYDYPI
ncbi:MAG: hypothetical protein Q8M06_06490 [Methanobacteriaceae archaeon]|nr:hypothetical protein [Methanobacteriaceae archaeon]